MIRELLQHPLTRGLELDDPATTEQRKIILRDKVFLRRIYEEWYRKINSQIPQTTGPVLELGSGAGFAESHIRDLITSDIIPIQGHHLCCNGLELPFSSAVFKALILINVFHHIPDADRFLSEAFRVTQPGGVLILIEPWVTPWSRIVYSRLHHEPFDPDAPDWKLPPSGPLTGGNDALAWIVFARDAEQFSKRNEWHLNSITPLMPFSYLLSGGVSMRSLVPGFLYTSVRALEQALPERFNCTTAMFAMITLRKPIDSQHP